MQATQKNQNKEVVINELYLKGVLKDLLQGKSISFHTQIYEKEFLIEKLKQIISKECFFLAKNFWNRTKLILNESLSHTPFVFFDERSLTFELSKGANSEEMYFSLDKEQLYFLGDPIVINPMFYQESYDCYQETHDDYVHHQSAKQLEIFLTKRIPLFVN